MTTMTETATQVYRVYIRTTPEKIWAAITTPEWSARYGYGGTVEYDLRPGGQFKAYTSQEMRDKSICFPPRFEAIGPALSALHWAVEHSASARRYPSIRVTPWNGQNCLALDSWCANRGNLRRIDKKSSEPIPAQGRDFVGPINENTHDEPP
jgi:hypothetical protein